MKSATIRALVTGGAGGIGGAIAAELLDRGGAVLLVDRDIAALDRAVARLARYGDRVGILPADLTSAADLRRSRRLARRSKRTDQQRGHQPLPHV